jgi:micrococcal nuclease
VRKAAFSIATTSAAVVASAVLVACSGSSTETSTAPVHSTAAVSLPSGLAPKGQTVDGTITRVVDGDTVHVDVDGQDVTVRMIGINTPETVKPGSPIECFGPEASQFAKDALTGQPVTLEFDASQGMTDKYDRTLAYVWHPVDGVLSLFNLEAVAGGYAFERQYGSSPYAWADEFRAASKRAKGAGLGLWGACDQP